MGIEYLKKFFGETDGEPKALTFDELSSAVSGDKDLKLYNLSDGGYVSKDKLDGKIAELANLKAQLEAASQEIQSYKDMDIESIKTAAQNWEKKYAEDTERLQKQLQEQEYEFQIRDLANGVKFSSSSAKKAFIADLMKDRLGIRDGKIMGFDDYVQSYRETDPDAFVKEADPAEQHEGPKPRFSEQKNATSKTKLSLTELMDMANEGKSVESFFSK